MGNKMLIDARTLASTSAHLTGHRAALGALAEIFQHDYMQHFELRMDELNINSTTDLETHIEDGMQSLPNLDHSRPRSPLFSTTMSWSVKPMTWP
jgi:hypothetical protein